MTPYQRYQADLAQAKVLPDDEQHKVVLHLQHIYQELEQARHNKLARLANKIWRKRPKPVQGLYLWGSVGVGKTYLMDLFFHSLASPRKLRLHYHHFMAEVHKLLVQLQGQRNPLQKVAAYFAAKAQVLCLDEFFVNDIGDAMILANLLQGLFQHGVCLITTSNVEPGELYKNGLQRNAFLPAIALLRKHTHILHLANREDYRLRQLAQVGVYFSPLDAAAQQHMQAWFKHYATEQTEVDEHVIRVLNRPIAVVRVAKEIAWFKFQDLCNIPRSQNDYLELAKRFKVLLVSEVPQFMVKDSDKVIYLINLVDICYDWRVKLIISAAVPLHQLYHEGRLSFEFRRTQSRLQEMQSELYLQGC